MMIDWKKEDMRISRSELKKAYDRLQVLAVPLSQLSKKQMKKLPVSEYYLDELKALAEITSSSARNRQIKRVTKLTAEENRHDIINTLFAIKFAPEQMIKVDSWYDRLNINDKSTQKQYVKQFHSAEGHTLHQLLLWVAYAIHLSDEELLLESQNDLATYIREVAILSQLEK